MICFVALGTAVFGLPCFVAFGVSGPVDAGGPFSFRPPVPGFLALPGRRFLALPGRPGLLEALSSNESAAGVPRYSFTSVPIYLEWLRE